MEYFYNKYIAEVADGSQVSNEYVKLSVKRHIDNLKESEQDPNYKYYFDDEAAQRAIKFIRLLRHTAGDYAGRPFCLQPFQEFILASIFGWKVRETGKRRFLKAYIEIPRKNGKSELAAAVALYMLIADREPGAQVFTAATKRDQAKIVLDAAKNMVQRLRTDSASIKKIVGVHQYNIHVLSTNSKMEALTAESEKLDGLNPHCAVIDEYGAHKTDKLVKVIETGMVGRSQPLLFIITTAYPNINYPCFAFRKVGIDILRGLKEDERTFFVIYTLDDNDDWNDENTWIKANPNIGQTPDWDGMRRAYDTAATYGITAESEFKNKNLNLWTTTGAVWVPDKVYMKGGTDTSPEKLKGRACYSGLDLSKNIDLTAWVLLFPPIESDPKYYVLAFFYCPADNIEQRSARDGVPYKEWEKAGYIQPTPGNVIDKDYILHDMERVYNDYDFKIMGYDKRYSFDVIPKIEAIGYETNAYPQTPNHFTSPIQELEILFTKGLIDHFNNPVLRWMISNIVIKQYPGGGIMFDRDKSIEKIDGVVALGMALGEYQTDEPTGPTVYQKRGIIILGN